MDDLRNTSLYKRLQSITEEDIINCRNRIVERIRLREEGNLSNSSCSRRLARDLISSGNPYSALLSLQELLLAKSAISLASTLSVLVFLRVLAFEKFLTSTGLRIKVSLL